MYWHLVPICVNVFPMAAAPRHRFEELARSLREEILRGAFPPGTLLPTERELQEAHHVSRTPVRRALAELIETGWAENLPNRGVLAKLGRPAEKSNRVAFIDNRDCVHKALFFRLHTLLDQKGYQLVHVDSQDRGTMAALEDAVDEGFAAAFVWPKVAFVDPEQLRRCQSRTAVIMVDHSLGGEAGELVMSDHMQGAREIVNHLIELGRKRIAVSGYFTHHEHGMFRFAGYLAAHHERGVRTTASNFLFSSTGGDEFEDTRLLSHRLRDHDRPDAIFVIHDMSVPAVVEAVFEAGLRIPEDVAVVGFGNDLPFTIEGRGLTPVGMNWDHFAEALVARLNYRLAHPHAPYQRALVPTRLIVRGSCGAPHRQWSAEGYELSSVTVTGRIPPQRALSSPSFS